ncbi:MAG: glycosyltransferase family 4 protein [Nitrososphaeria archaeon]
MGYKKVLLVAERDTITGRLKSGPSLRLKYGVDGYSFIVKEDPVSQSRYVRNLSFNSMTTLYMLLKALLHRVTTVNGDFDFVHAFFWTFYRYRKPWIHENDQSPSQLIFNYFKMKNGFGQRIVNMIANLLNNSQAVITWTNYAARWFVNDGVEKNLVHMIPLPMDVKCDRKEHEGINMLFVGRDYYRKGGDIAIRAIMSILEKYKDVSFTYVGKGSVPEHPRIKHYEGLPRKQLEDLYRVSDILLYPSREEAYGLAALEALSYGIPVIASGLPSLKEIVDDSVDGYIAKSEFDYTERIEELIRSPDKLNNFSKMACEKVKIKHDPKKISEELKKIYESIG